jgi:hypothetical protein
MLDLMPFRGPERPASSADGRAATRIRVSGTLQFAPRGPVLLTKDGAWLLETDEDIAGLEGPTLVVEGLRHGLDRIRVDYVARAGGAP